MNAARRYIHDPVPREPDGPTRRTRRTRGLVAGLLLALCAPLLLASAAFGEGSADMNTGPRTAVRQALDRGTVLRVYARAGETIQLGHSGMGMGASDIRVIDPAGAAWFCNAQDPGTGVIASRAQELAGPEAGPDGDPDTWVPCEYVAPADGIYSVSMFPPGTINQTPGTVEAPLQFASNYIIAMWDITVRDASDAVQLGRMFATTYNLRSDVTDSSDTQVFVYTRTGYEYEVSFVNQAGLNWNLISNDVGVIDAATGDRLFASFSVDSDGDGVGDDTRAALSSDDSRRYPQFLNRPDPVVINGPGGLAATRGYATAPITPASNPLANLAFTGSGGQPGATNRGVGGTIEFRSPTQLADLGYTLAIDFNRDGTFGNGNDVADRTHELSASGTNAYAWNGLDGAGAAPQCGDYQYQVRSTLSEVHFAMNDVENSGGMTVRRLTLPGDATLGNEYALSYNDIDPFKNFDVTNATPDRVTDGDSSQPGFHAWDDITGNVDLVDTWTRLPEVASTGTLRILCADLRIEKAAAPVRYQPGGELSFSLTATNHGPDEAVNPVVTDTLPAGLTVVSTDPECTVAGQTVTCRLASLAANARHAFRVTTRVASNATGCLRNAAAVDSGTFDPNRANNTTSICVPPAESNVRVVKTSSTSPVVPGEDVLYRLTVSNLGPDTALDVVVTDRLPRALRFISASSGCVEANGTVTCRIASLANGASESFTITTRAPSSLKQCPNNTATVRSLTLDTDLTNNDDSACPPLRGKTDLSITKTPSATSVAAGGQIMYTLVVRNNGPSDATGVLVEDPLVTGLTLVSAQPGQGACSVNDGRVSCNLGNLDAGGSTQILVTATAPATAQCPVNTATVRGDQQDTNQRNNSDSARICTTTTERDPVFDLVVVKTANRRVVTLGETVTYKILVTNKGPDAAPDTRVTDTFNAKGTLVSVKTTAGRCVAQLPIDCSLGTMRVGQRETITVKLRPTTVGRGQDNTASATGDGRDRNPRDNIDGAVIAVRRIDLRLTKVVNRTVGRPGSTFTYTIRVSNPTKGTARNVRVCDDLPSGLVFVSASAKARLVRGQYCWAPIKKLGAGKSKTFRMTVRALRGASGRKVNTAVATSPDAKTKRARRAVQIIGGGVSPAGGVTG